LTPIALANPSRRPTFADRFHLDVAVGTIKLNEDHGCIGAAVLAEVEASEFLAIGITTRA
jgi:hypothetical protein